MTSFINNIFQVIQHYISCINTDTVTSYIPVSAFISVFTTTLVPLYSEQFEAFLSTLVILPSSLSFPLVFFLHSSVLSDPHSTNSSIHYNTVQVLWNAVQGELQRPLPLYQCHHPVSYGPAPSR